MAHRKLVVLAVCLVSVLTGCKWDRSTYALYHFMNTGESASASEVDAGLRNLSLLGHYNPDKLKQIETVFLLAVSDATSKSGRVLDNDGLYRLRMCESTNNYTINTGNGYYGAYQFSVTTWNWVAQKHLPHLEGVRPDLATQIEQDAMAKVLWSMDGGGPSHWDCEYRV